MSETIEDKVKQDTIVSKHLINGRTYNLMTAIHLSGSEIPCDRCIFNHNAELCNGQGGDLCEVEYTSYLAESTLNSCSKGHYNERGEFIIPIRMIEKPKETKEETKTALNVQVGGGHYKDMKIQPVEYIHANNLSFLEGNVVKYITRHKTKNKAQDIRKIIHYCTLILQLEYNETYEQESK